MSVNETKLYNLRELLIATCIAELKNRPVIGMDVVGNPILAPITPAMLNVIRQTLSDNGITREPLEPGYGQTTDVKDIPFEETIVLPEGPPTLMVEHTSTQTPDPMVDTLSPPTPTPEPVKRGQKRPVTGKNRRHTKS